MVGGEIECDEPDLGAAILGLNANDMHVAGRAGAQFDLIVIGADVNLMAIVVVVAGEAFGRACGLADGLMAMTLDNVTVVSHVLAIKGLDLVG